MGQNSDAIVPGIYGVAAGCCSESDTDDEPDGGVVELLEALELTGEETVVPR